MSGGREAFALLHPAVQHHVINSLGWPDLRPLQALTIAPILAGDHVLATAPTAGGKTEAAVLPLLSRMLTEDWRGLSVLYICPLRALLNSLHERLEGYAGLVGRRAGVWHGDVAGSARGRMLADPPDLLLTTPESLEGMLISNRVEHRLWFASLRAVVVDEVHAFAGDDRGWHLLAVLERAQRLSGRELQRVALSATVGNPEQLLAWLTATTRGQGRVIAAPAGEGTPEVGLDYVGTLTNAATVISRLHRGEKRLVFVDSRARAEQLAFALRQREVMTFVSHASLAADERRAAERAFAEARDCAIVATSTLELGIDVGDLDRVIQIDHPPSVSSFLQRLGRTGRRGGVGNSLVLATSDGALLRSAAVLLRWAGGYVEQVVAPPEPWHILAQQILALALQERGIGRHRWQEWLGVPNLFGPAAPQRGREIVEHLLATGYLFDDGAGTLGIGVTGEEAVGRRHFIELLSVFTSVPSFLVRDGRQEVGQVPDEALLMPARNSAPRVLALGGRSWIVRHIDWRRRVVDVEPTALPGTTRWSGAARPLGASVARAVREVLLGRLPGGVTVSRRASDCLTALRGEHPWVQPGATCLVASAERGARWWTFAGWKANLVLAQAAGSFRTQASDFDDLSIALDPGVALADLGDALKAVDIPPPIVDQRALRGLKFAACLPRALAENVVADRLADPGAAHEACRERLTGWRG